jgi:hypothetical protein
MESIPMLDDANLRRLAEMGIEVYLPRGAGDRATNAAIGMPETAPPASRQAVADVVDAPADVLLLTGLPSSHAAALLADVSRALAFARMRSAQTASPDEAALGAARVLVAFGEAQARAVGALLPAQRQREMAWVVSAEPALLIGDARARRALWSELRRALRGLAAGRESARR